ncbi:hypothetical protein DFQ01_10221 [Paenibacillus cellulosilyticus]|uniref:Uncharacterized protein n=1 Tax=Paenibacillus cellulosilyticus TaxID=375489 RepID=A0A2V2YYA3_9BACL|nr:hypothetical protein DFQ01_10221 [Paenibacillus cellulosilyticus]
MLYRANLNILWFPQRLIRHICLLIFEYQTSKLNDNRYNSETRLLKPLSPFASVSVLASSRCYLYDRGSTLDRLKSSDLVDCAAKRTKSRAEEVSSALLHFKKVHIIAYLNTGALNCSSFSRELCSTSACRLLPCESIVTMAAKPSVCRCHIASGMPNSLRK